MSTARENDRGDDGRKGGRRRRRSALRNNDIFADDKIVLVRLVPLDRRIDRRQDEFPSRAATPTERESSQRPPTTTCLMLSSYVLSLAMAETRRGRSLKEGRGREGLLQLASYCAVCPSAPPRYLSLRRKLRNWRLAGFQEMCLGCEKLSNKLPAPKN